MAIEIPLQRSQEIDNILQAQIAANTVGEANKHIAKNPQLKTMLEDLGKTPDSLAISQIIGRWAQESAGRSSSARDALVIAAGFWFYGWQESFTDPKLKVYTAARATSALLSMDGPTGSGDIITYGNDIYNKLILPSVLHGNQLTEEEKLKYLEAITTNSYSNTPYHALKEHAGFRDRLKGKTIDVLQKASSLVPSGRLKKAISDTLNRFS